MALITNRGCARQHERASRDDEDEREAKEQEWMPTDCVAVAARDRVHVPGGTELFTSECHDLIDAEVQSINKVGEMIYVDGLMCIPKTSRVRDKSFHFNPS